MMTIEQIVKFISDQQKNAMEVINYLKTIPTHYLIEFSCENKLIETWCEHSDLDSYWLDIWCSLGRFPIKDEATPKNPYRPLQPQKNISNFNLVRGMHFYNKANSLPQNEMSAENAEVINLLNTAARYHNFAALRGLTNLCFEQNELKKYEWLLSKLNNAASIHGTPVFILCAFVCLKIRQLPLHELSGDAKINSKNLALQNALSYLFTAAEVEKFSEAAIHNAYYGRGLAESNQWCIDNTQGLITQLCKVRTINPNDTIYLFAKSESKAMVTTFLKNHSAVDDDETYYLSPPSF